MSSEKEIDIIKKAAMYDLLHILSKEPGKSFSLEELRIIIDAYLFGPGE